MFTNNLVLRIVRRFNVEWFGREKMLEENSEKIMIYLHELEVHS